MTTKREEVIQTLGLDGNKRKLPWRWIVPIFIVVALVVFLQRGPADQPIEYSTVMPHRGNLQVTVTATGTLQPTKQVDIGSEVSGIIQEVFVDFNDVVKAGQVLARLDTQQLEARLASSRAALLQAQASLAQSNATLTEVENKLRRSRSLVEENAVSHQELDADEAASLRAAASVQSSEAQVNSAKAALKESETALAKARISSPIDGIIITREVDPGQTVAASFQTPVLFVVAEDLTKMLLHLDVDESDIGMIKEGQQAKFRVDAYPRQEFDAEIVSVRFSPQEVNNIVTYEAVLTLSNPDLLLRPGMTATAEILIEEKNNVVLVPNRSLRFLPPEEVSTAEVPVGDKVWILENNKPAAIAVSIGSTDGEYTELLSGNINQQSILIIDVNRGESASPQGGGPFR